MTTNPSTRATAVVSLRAVIATAAFWLLAAGCASSQTETKPAPAETATVAVCPIAPAAQGSIDDRTRDALLAALDDERQAIATYEAIMAKQGERRPFSRIVNAERQHAARIAGLLQAYDVAIPPDPWVDHPPAVPATWADSCRRAVEFEKANVEMYGEFLTFVQQDDIRMAFEALRSASLNHHLPAFERFVT